MLDPESLRDMMSRYFDGGAARHRASRGMVEKFIGDAVMAVFGVPRVHEDDALRAVRAADEMRTTLAALNGEFAAIWGVTVLVRTGVNTGEVLAGERPGGESIVLGDAVNVAARLEQAAEPGEILIGEATYRLVHDAVDGRGRRPADAQGQGRAGARVAPAAGRRPTRPAGAAGSTRRSSAATRELADLERAFGRAADRADLRARDGHGPGRRRQVAADRRAPRPAWARRRGSSRAAASPTARGSRSGRWSRSLMQALDIGERDPESEARRRMCELVADDSAPGEDAGRVADALAPLLGFGAGGGIQETFWAVRRLLERLAAGRPGRRRVRRHPLGGADVPRPASSTWATGSGRVPVLLVCQARPELLEIRPAWLTAKDERDPDRARAR